MKKNNPDVFSSKKSSFDPAAKPIWAVRFFTLFFIAIFLSFRIYTDEVKSGIPRFFFADDTSGIIQNMGNVAVVEGRVHSAFWVRYQVFLITFREEREGFLAVAFPQSRKVLDAGLDGNMAAALNGRLIRVRGVIGEHRYRPQIIVESPDQIEILD